MRYKSPVNPDSGATEGTIMVSAPAAESVDSAMSLASTGFDLASILYGLRKLELSELPGMKVVGDSSAHNALLRWRRQFGLGIEQIPGMIGLASRRYETLNDLLTQEGFSIRLQPFGSHQGVGVVSLMRLDVHWREQGQPCNISLSGPEGQPYEAFQMSDADIFKLPGGGDDRLIRLHDHGDLNVWIHTGSVYHSGLDLFGHALRLHHQRGRVVDRAHNGVVIPRVTLRTQADLTWMKGLGMRASQGDYLVDQALQELQVEMDYLGAEARVATAIAGVRNVQPSAPPLIIDGPFTMWWTHADSFDLPLAVVHARRDSWVPVGNN